MSSIINDLELKGNRFNAEICLFNYFGGCITYV
jgi:hypothetical protein